MLSRSEQLQARALTVGKYASLGFLKTQEAWRNTIALAGLGIVLLGGNSAVLNWRAAVANHKRRKAAAEFGLEDVAAAKKR